VLGAIGIVVAVMVAPVWVGLGVVYLAGTVAWTARAVGNGLRRLQEAGGYEPLPVERQAAMVGRVGMWLLVVGVLGIAVALFDIESRGGVAAWDFILVAVAVVAGVVYRRRAAELSPPTTDLSGRRYLPPNGGTD
jgi:hypothetical protein